jgi:hypothetical protein
MRFASVKGQAKGQAPKRAANLLYCSFEGLMT